MLRYWAVQPASFLVLSIVVSLPANASIENVRVVGTTATQAVLAYTASDTNPCTLEVSENPFVFSPLVHDLDATLFPGSNQDGGGATARIWVVGKRAVGLALDGNKYSRALQAYTTHYYRLTCGTQQTTGTFATMNIPPGNTFADLLPLDNSTAPPTYLFPTIPHARNATVIDPLTGALIKRITVSDLDYNTSESRWWSGANNQMCQTVQYNGGYLCAIPTLDAFNKLFWIDAATGDAHWLGLLHLDAATGYQERFPSIGDGGFDTVTPGVFYGLTATTQTPPKEVLFKYTYTGPTTEQPEHTIIQPTSYTVSYLTPSPNGTIPDLLTAFDANFNSGGRVFDRCAFHGVQRDIPNAKKYGVFDCHRAQQDSDGWLFAMDITNSTPGNVTVVAVNPAYAHPNSPWCGIHSVYYMGDTPHMYMISQAINNVGSGPYEVTLNANVTNTATSFAITSPNAGVPTASGTGVAADGIPTLRNSQLGDFFFFEDGGIQGEVVQISALAGQTSWTVNRGCHHNTSVPIPFTYICDGKNADAVTPVSSHLAGAKLRGLCTLDIGLGSDYYWNFLTDPHGTADGSFPTNTNTHFIREGYNGGSHTALREPWVVDEGNFVRNGVYPGQFNTPETHGIDNNPPFAGFVSFAQGTSSQKHPGMNQLNPTWFADAWPFTWNGDFSSLAVLVQADVNGNLYKYTSSGAPFLFDTTKLPYFATTGATLLKDVSGPTLGNTINAGAADNWKFCLVKVAGECRVGSSPGESYANIPATLTTLGCGSGDTGVQTGDLCVQHTSAWNQAINQFGLNASDASQSRVLVRGVTGQYKHANLFGMESGANAHALPNGNWLYYDYKVPTGSASYFPETMAIKVPPMPAPDGIDRTNFINVPVVVGTAAGAASARVKYGYEENGPRLSFYCTQRPETCSVTAAPNSSVNLPGISQRVLFYQIEYLDGAGQVISTSNVGAVAIK